MPIVGEVFQNTKNEESLHEKSNTNQHLHDICRHIAGSHCCTAETKHNIVKQLYSNKKKLKKLTVPGNQKYIRGGYDTEQGLDEVICARARCIRSQKKQRTQGECFPDQKSEASHSPSKAMASTWLASHYRLGETRDGPTLPTISIIFQRQVTH